MTTLHPIYAALLPAPVALLSAAPPTLQDQSWPLRHSDGLLDSRVLQNVVAAQCARDAAELEKFLGMDKARGRSETCRGDRRAPEVAPKTVDRGRQATGAEIEGKTARPEP